MSKSRRLPKLPSLIDRKLYKTGQTRGAAVQEIYQNRVLRNSTVLIPWEYWDACKVPDDGTGKYENGFIVLLDPDWYLATSDADTILKAEGVELGVNAVLYFQKRSQWNSAGIKEGDLLPNGLPLVPPTSRTSPINGTLLARMHSTTSEKDKRITIGYNEKALRGAGIRVYEYASQETIKKARLQLEAYFWLSSDSIAAVVNEGMKQSDATSRRDSVLAKASDAGLLDRDQLQELRIIDEDNATICPLCLERIPASLFFKRGEQAEGRETWDITVTEVSLFHIEELRVGKFQHKPYNLGWGHHFCNVVTKDSGIEGTLEWMDVVVQRNRRSGWRSQRSNNVPASVSDSSEATGLLKDGSS
ncbi:BstXI family restriction endonuclease [Corynebacterium sp. P5875]|uniref:BstXI family restriction endonuclease n=1 Tax=Corynebacterium antarcticum TaxID=2800405 RepID=A0A9Q4GP51_9CORY|nr:BstXI family restriction endonuclease [Corynebacterium antarcticum]MCX7538344.1 BstXI family restriction endonuclease [Corynebacterium antarcticum]